MAKLGEQLQAQKEAQQSTRQTRTERVAEKQEYERQKAEYLKNKAKAEEIQKSEFSNITSVDEYEEKYNALSPEIQQFFSDPDTVRENRATEIESAKTSVSEKIAYYQQKMADKKEYYKEKEDYYEDKAKYYLKKGDTDRANRYYEKAQDYEDRGDEYEEYYEGIIKGLNEGLKKLNADQYLTYDAIYDYAKDVGSYERDKEEAKNEAKSTSRVEARKIKDLEQAGYTAQIIQKYSSGKPVSVSLDYYNKATGDWVSVATLEDTATVDISKLEKLGYSEPQERSLYVGGKEYKFSSRVGIYKEADGDIVTAYGKTGYTEDQLIKQAQDEAYTKWASERTIPIYDTKTEPTAFTLGGKTYVPTTDFIGYVDQGTISTEPKYVELPSGVDYKKIDLDAGWSTVKNLYSKIPAGSWTLSPLGISPFSTGTSFEINLTEKIGKAKDWLSGKTTNIDEQLQALEVVEPKLAKVEEYYQTQGQARFEDLYAKDLIYGDITLEQAQKEFETSQSYKDWQKQYAEEYGDVFKEAIARENIGYGSAFKYGSQKFLTSIGEFGLGRIETPKATAETGAVVGAVVLTYGQLSPAVASAVSWGLTGATGVYGAYKLFSPTSTPTEVFGGAVMLGTAVASASYQAYKYLNRPVVKTVEIKPPKSTLKASQTKGYDVKYITDQGEINKVIYQNQKLSQTGIAGRRTTVTTQWRSLANKYLKTNFKNIYEGIPTQQLAKTYTVQGLRGSYTVTVGKSGYQKAYDLLKKYGYTDYQATATLRYTAPRIYEQYLRSGEIYVKGSKAVGQFKFETTRPVIDVDDTLGIKTRGGGTTVDYTTVQRQLLQSETGQKFILENQLTKTYGVNLKGVESFKKVSEQWNLGVAGVSDTKAGLDVVALDKAYTVYEKVAYKDIIAGSRTFLKGTGTISKDLVKLNLEMMPKDVSVSRTILIEKIQDLTKTSYGTTFTGGKKTPFSKTFGISDDLLDKVTKIKTPSTDIAKIVDKLDDIKISTPSASQSKYYGTGMYERSAGGVSPQQLQVLQNQLKTITIPDVKVDALKDIIQFKTGADITSKIATAELTALGLNVGVKSDLQLKADLKAQTDLKNLIKTDLGIKSVAVQDVGVKSDTVLKTQLKSLLDLTTPTISLREPTFKVPTISTPSIPIPTGVVIPYLKDQISRKARVKSTKGFEELAYLPDFTSRALGLEAETVSQKQAQKKLKQLLTGLEVRRGIKVKW